MSCVLTTDILTQTARRLCFNNRHSHTDSKKVVSQFDIEGGENVLQHGEEMDLGVNLALEE